MIPSVMLALAGNAQQFIGFRLSGVQARQPYIRMEGSATLDTVIPANQALIGFGAAAPLEFRLTDRLGLVAEPAYMQRGHRTRQDSSSHRWRHHYLDLSLLARYAVGRGPVQLELSGGAAGSVLAGVDWIRQRDSERPRQAVRSAVPMEGYQQLDVSLVGGIGLGIRTGPSRIVVDLRYHHGLLDVFENPMIFLDGNGNTLGRYVQRNRCISLGVGWLLPINRRAAPTGT